VYDLLLNNPQGCSVVYVVSLTSEELCAWVTALEKSEATKYVEISDDIKLSE